ncbi:MAG TPA: hypothetical protein VM008_09155 [Phycisphaerae bacterium]|nr:hypothetical protein [Phycisphaerae bacterium]
MSESTPPAPSPAPTDAPIIARASSTVRNKNLLIVLMCLAMACWFAYDGFIGWPSRNNQLVDGPISTRIKDDPMYAQYLPVLTDWKGWNDSDAHTRDVMSGIAHALNTEGWKTDTDISNQKYIVIALAIATLASIVWFAHCQRRRAIAQGDTVSPSPGIIIPWQKITLVDNNRWKSMGIVTITYDIGEGPKKAKFDDYETEREPLLMILDQLAEKAVNAEFIPKDEVESGGGVGGAVGGANAQGTAGIDGPTTGNDAKTEGSRS